MRTKTHNTSTHRYVSTNTSFGNDLTIFINMNHHTHMMQHLTHHLKKALDKKTYNKETI
ncbi:hypothetical protein GW750_01635 [bacterium]|nr:hypothetical protein [bacterium]